jgi:5-methylcytosine-specific restriction endonuclease McrA
VSLARQPLKRGTPSWDERIVTGEKPLKRTALRKEAKNTKWKSALDKLARQVVFQRDGHKCARCGKSENIQWCHVNSRRYLSTRWMLENSLAMCAGCHLLWHHRPTEAAEWFAKTYPERIQHLTLVRAEKAHRIDAELTRIYLQSMLDKGR